MVTQYNQRSAMVLEEAYRNDVKVWIVSSSNEFKCLIDCNYLKLLTDCNQPFNIKGSNEREIEETIKNALRVISDKKQILAQERSSRTSTSSNTRKKRGNKKVQVKDPKNVIFFNGNSLTFILRDENLKKSFLLLCSMSNFMIGSKTTS